MVSTRRKRVTSNDNIPNGDGDVDCQSPSQKRRPAKIRKNSGDHNDPFPEEKGKVQVSNNEASASTSTRPTKKPTRGLQGRLAGLMNMPVDIFSDICLYLHPLDLLHLAWASKALRRILMSKTSNWIWTCAREYQVADMPGCPEGLTEPQYAALVFTTVCQACGSGRALRLYYGLYSRYCNQCTNDHVMVIDGIEQPLLHWYLSWDQITRIIPRVEASEIGGSQQQRFRWASRETLLELYKEWLTLSTQEAKNAFISSHSAIVENVDKHAAALEKWQSEQDHKKKLKLKDVRMTRSASIKERLLAMEWDDEDFPAHQSTAEEREWYKLTQKNQVLTDKVWSNLYPRLLPLLEVFRTRRLKRERF